MGCSSPTARVVSAHRQVAQRRAGRHPRWPQMRRQAQPRQALGRWGAAARGAPGGAWRSPGAPTGPHPAGPPRGTRQADTVFGLLDACSGPLCDPAPPGRGPAESDPAGWRAVLTHTSHQVVGRHEGAREHTRKAMPVLCARHAAQWTLAPRPASAPDFTPLAHLWQQVTKEATQLTQFSACTDLPHAVDRALRPCVQAPRAMTVLMARYGEKRGHVDKAASQLHATLPESLYILIRLSPTPL